MVMLELTAKSEIKRGNTVVGYTLLDKEGNTKDVNCNSIIAAIKDNLVSIDNLRISANGTLELIQKDNNEADESPDMIRIRELVTKLNEARKVYEQGTDEIMSNFEYDKLYDELEKLENKLGVVLANSPTHAVGYEVVSKLPKEKHEKPMLSLGKTKDRTSLVGWLNGKEGVLSWKLDGLTVVLTYENGQLSKAVTRGDGEIGEVITPNAKQFKNLPKVIAYKGKLVLRGEAVISYNDFNRINDSITIEDEKYKNPRNLCSGSVRQLDSSITAKRNVNWLAFELVNYNEVGISSNFDEQLEYLRKLGFTPVDHVVVNSNNILSEIEKYSVAINSFELPSDGLVLTYRDRKYGESLGRTAKSPRHSIAFKWQDECVETYLKDIEWSPSRTGLINPVAIFEPVEIDGTTVERASVHNLSIMSALKLGYNDRILVYKANMIIPQILENLSGTETCEIPSECPCCGYPTEIHEEPKSGVLTLWCSNDNCDAKSNKSLEHFVKRDCMNIEGISESTLNTLAREGIITDFASIYHIKEYMEEICNLEGFGYTSFTNMVEAIEKSRNVRLYNLIYALGIPNVGLATAKLICSSLGNNLMNVVSANYATLISIDGIGDVIAESFVNYFADKENADRFIALVKELNIIQEETRVSSEMAGVTICVTGDVYIFPNRRAIKDLVESLGGKLTGSVSRSTHYLITNDTTSGSNKNKMAQQYGIPILTEQEFIDKFNLSQYI